MASPTTFRSTLPDSEPPGEERQPERQGAAPGLAVEAEPRGGGEPAEEGLPPPAAQPLDLRPGRRGEQRPGALERGEVDVAVLGELAAREHPHPPDARRPPLVLAD